MINLGKLIEGPAVIYHRGQYFESRGGAGLDPVADAFAIDTDRYGPLDQRSLDNSIALTLTPIGVWSDAVIDVLWRWRNPTIGQLVTPVYDIDSIDLTSDVVTLVGSLGPRIGCPVLASSFGTLPAGLDGATLYYAGCPDTDTPNEITLHATEADAIAGTNKINVTGAGTGDHTLIEQEPVIIWTAGNRKITFHNGAVVGMPPIRFSARETLIGQVRFEMFRKNNAAWSDADSLFTIEKAALNVTPPDPADIPTQPYELAWGASPWDAFRCREAVEFTPNLALTPVETDQLGTVGRKISGLSATATGRPDGFSEQQLLDILAMQGGTAGRGVSKVRADLEISGTGVYATLYNAAARSLPQTFSPTDPRAGNLEWISGRSPTNAAFYLGTSAES